MSSPATWFVRLPGEPEPRKLETPHAVLEGVRDGDWEPGDEVRGPGDGIWRPIEEHPAFADAIAEMGPPPPMPEDETKLDMNPLIDVALVLLIFFILTAAYTTLRRTIEIPPPESEGGAPKIQKEEIVDRTFNVKVDMDGDERPIITINDRSIVYEKLDQELKETVKSTGRKEMILKATDKVIWDVIVRIQGAANEAGVNAIYMPEKK